MYSRDEACGIVRRLSSDIAALFPQEHIDAILFGSYARNEAEDGSDIDVVYVILIARAVRSSVKKVDSETPFIKSPATAISDKILPQI